MTQLTFINQDGSETQVEAEDGLSVLVAAQANNIKGIKGICNGCCSCGSCHITLPKEAYHIASTKYSGEQQVLDKIKVKEAYSRLACQVIVRPELCKTKIIVK